MYKNEETNKQPDKKETDNKQKRQHQTVKTERNNETKNLTGNPAAEGTS